MRLWSIHPGYLDLKGLLAVWREALLAQKVLRGKTRGYKHHPQLERFRDTTAPLEAIGRYLEGIRDESLTRGYRFDGSKILKKKKGFRRTIRVSKGQLDYEWAHLKKKIALRDRTKYQELKKMRLRPRLHPLFRAVSGGIASWEKVKGNRI
jgi:hypothetical protein